MTGTTREQRVGGGLWWNGGTWTIRSVPPEGGALPDTGTPWRRVPGWLMVPLAPVVGGLFVVVLPVVAAVMVVQAVARAAASGGGQAARDLAATVAASPARPGEAHLAGRAGEPAAPTGPGAAAAGPEAGAAASPREPIDEVDAEVQARRTH